MLGGADVLEKVLGLAVDDQGERLLRKAQPLLSEQGVKDIEAALTRPITGNFDMLTATRGARGRTVMRTEIQDRGRHVLERLLQTTGADHGHLYAMLNGKMQRLASLPTAPVAEQDAALTGSVERFVARQLVRAREAVRSGNHLSLPPRPADADTPAGGTAPSLSRTPPATTRACLQASCRATRRSAGSARGSWCARSTRWTDSAVGCRVRRL